MTLGVKLTIDNSLCRIEGLGVKQFNELRDLMSYSLDAQAIYFSQNYGSTKRHLMDKKGFFPTGLLYIAKKYLIAEVFQELDLRIKPKGRSELFHMVLGVPPYAEQLDASKAVSERYRGIVVAPTGVGKSVIAALIVNKLQVPTLIVVPSLELKRQLTDSMTAIYGHDRVGGLGLPLAIENIDALDTSKPLKGYDCIIIDEFHHAAASTYRKLNLKCWKDVFYRVGLTATAFRSQENERLLLESVLSETIYKIDYSMAVTKNYIVPLEAYYYELPKTSVSGYTWAEVYSELVVNNHKRNLIISDCLKKLRANGLATLCLVKHVDHGNKLSELSCTPFTNGEDEWTRTSIPAFNNGYIKTLIGTTGVLGEGVDTKPAEYIVIAGLGKSKNQFMQACGRGFRKYLGKESCKVIIFKDASHKWTLAHFKAQCKVLKEEYGVTPVKLT